MQSAELNDLILAIYDTTINPGAWPEVLDRASRYIGATGAMIFELEGPGDRRRILAPHVSKIYDAELVASYIKTYHDEELTDQDIFTSLSKPTDQIHFVTDDALTNSEAELLARANVRAMVENGIRYRMAALLNKDLVDRDRFALQFTPRAGPISKEHVEKALLIAPHIAKARNISRPTKQLADNFRSVADCIDMLIIGVCILDRQGRIVHLNQEFQRQIDNYPVFRKDRSGRLIMRSAKPAEALDELRGSLANHGRFGARPRKEAINTIIDDKPNTLCVEVAPLTTADEFGEPKLNGHIVYSMDAGNFYEIDSEILASIFSLTQAEASILELLAEGLTNAQISERRAKSVETVNSQVKSILEKTQSANRTQLIRLATNISSSFVVDRGQQPGSVSS
jgi:DNA-binding CsgD family transcriptional regulator